MDWPGGPGSLRPVHPLTADVLAGAQCQDQPGWGAAPARQQLSVGVGGSNRRFPPRPREAGRSTRSRTCSADLRLRRVPGRTVRTDAHTRGPGGGPGRAADGVSREPPQRPQKESLPVLPPQMVDPHRRKGEAGMTRPGFYLVYGCLAASRGATQRKARPPPFRSGERLRPRGTQGLTVGLSLQGAQLDCRSRST